ncbi:hypothetical protein Tco_0406338, partial [Tanacetum coccineum]
LQQQLPYQHKGFTGDAQLIGPVIIHETTEEQPVEAMDREIKQLKRSRIPIIKVRLNSKRGPEFT